MKGGAVVAALLLTGCGGDGEPAATSASAPSAPPSAPSEPVVPPAAVSSDGRATDLVTVCTAAMAMLHEQEIRAISAQPAPDGVALSWPAPVDGGRMRVECRLEADRVLWRNPSAPDAEARRWRGGGTDPVVRFTAPDGRVVISVGSPVATTGD